LGKQRNSTSREGEPEESLHLLRRETADLRLQTDNMENIDDNGFTSQNDELIGAELLVKTDKTEFSTANATKPTFSETGTNQIEKPASSSCVIL
jgi:hypothetical protein